jgi:hypothetical protein
MAVQYIGGKKNSMLGTLLSVGSMFLPMVAPAAAAIAPFMNAAGQLMNGNAAGAATSAVGGIASNFNANTPQVNEDSLTGALREAWKNEYGPKNTTADWDEYKNLLRMDQAEYNNLKGLWGNQNRRRTF